MLVRNMNLFGLISILLYFCVQFICTQKIYTNNYFFRLLIFGVINFCAAFYFLRSESIDLRINIGSLIFYYAFLLYLIKKSYKKINKLLVEKDFINDTYLEKDFTYMNWNSKNPTSSGWWDEKLTLPPSWLDRLLSYLLLITPLLILWGINYLFKKYE